MRHQHEGGADALARALDNLRKPAEHAIEKTGVALANVIEQVIAENVP